MKKTGAIQLLNVSPKGCCEGILLKTGKSIVQINLPKKELGAWDGRLKIGDDVAVEVEAEEPRGDPEHKVFHLSRFLELNGHTIEGRKKAAENFSGRIKSINYARHGERNGGILSESGDFLHLKPEGAREIQLKVGMAVKGRGHRKPMVGGTFVIEAKEVNGIAIGHHHKSPKKHGGKH